MKHFVYREVLFTIGKDYKSDISTLKLIYVNCQWQNYRKEVCDVDILVAPDEFAAALDGDDAMRILIYSTFTFHLMALFNPAVIS